MPERTIAELNTLIERATGGRDGRHPTALPGLSLFRASTTNERVGSIYEPALCLMAQGRKRMTLGDEVYDYDPEQLLLTSVALPLVGEVIEASPERPYLALRLDLDSGDVGTLVADLGVDAPPPAAGPLCRGLAVSPVEPPLLDAVVRLVSLLDAPASLASSPR